MAGLDDLFYPDNANRRRRAVQPMAQFVNLTNEIADKKLEIDKLLLTIKKTRENQ
ncbi:hypothetical protein [Bacillus sp. AR18-7]|uniref:hypothetical protein n=1 Tax=Bacillus sp. AR18-7 TaxID=2217821 RepID=UPI0015D450B8|nr:hypothetical protein [Bacillus sp. AR18-7]